MASLVVRKQAGVAAANTAGFAEKKKKRENKTINQGRQKYTEFKVIFSIFWDQKKGKERKSNVFVIRLQMPWFYELPSILFLAHKTSGI